MWAGAETLVTAFGSTTALVFLGDLIGYGLAHAARRKGAPRGSYRGRLIPVTFEWGDDRTAAEFDTCNGAGETEIRKLDEGRKAGATVQDPAEPIM